jgi:HlyD family secretion protein
MAVALKGKLALGVAVLVGIGLGYWWYQAHEAGRQLYGDVEIREVDLAFNAEGRVATMSNQEGDRVKAGQLIATLDDGTYSSALDLAKAQQGQAQAKLDLLLAGSRFEDIDRARAALASAEAQLVNAQGSYNRQAGLVGRGATPQQTLDDAKAALDSAQAAVSSARAQLTELINGPRPQEIEAGRAALNEATAQVALAQTEENDTRLYAPVDGVIMTRVVEPGTVVLPSSTIYALANTSETWVRAFVPETMLGDVAPGTKVTITNDTKGAKPYHGVIGYVSPEAEFTPKTVETPDLRTQLVYRFRVRVTDADSGLRQGMPVTITLPGG